MSHARRSLLFAAIAVASAGLAAGCASWSDHAAWNLKRAVANPGYVDTTEMEDDEWITDAADMGRKGRTVEVSNDPWDLRELFMSEKARSIERNVGIE